MTSAEQLGIGRAFGVVCSTVFACVVPTAGFAQDGQIAGGLNDLCADAEQISDVGEFPFDSTNAQTDGPDHVECLYSNQTQIDNDVWFCWTAPQTACTAGYVIETCGFTDVDTRIAVYDGCACPPTGANLLTCSDDDCGPTLQRQTRVTVPASPGQQYLIRVGNYPGFSGGPGAVNIFCPQEPDNDDCINAELINTEGLFEFDSTLATTDGDSHTDCLFSFEDQIANDVWFCWEAPCDATVFADTCEFVDFDSKMAVYEGCACPAPGENLLSCNDDRCGPEPFLQSRLTFEATSGQSYLFRIGSYPQTTPPGGFGALQLSCGIEACPGTGDCFVDNGTVGCDDQSCCEKVCEFDPDCCLFGWDALCAQEAEGYCNGHFTACGGPDTIDCDLANNEPEPVPGCSDVDCCNAVCLEDAFCCLQEWDSTCASSEPVICRSACGPGAGGCLAGNGSPGCQLDECCNEVCRRDPFCCQSIGDWDGACADLAASVCQQVTGCPTGPVSWVDPPHGVVDARYPADPKTGAPLGITELLVEAPSGAPPECFALCEPDATASPNQIVSVVENQTVAGPAPIGTYTITLARPLTAGAVTSVTYTDDLNTKSTGRFAFHPANVNGDSAATPTDVLSMIDFLNGVDIPGNAPWGLYSTDVDRSGVANPTDVLAVIDLLNGSGAFDEWLNTPLPEPAAGCP